MENQEQVHNVYDAYRERFLVSHKSYYTAPASEAIEPFRIADRLWYVGDKKVCVHLIDTDEGLILIDSGFPCSIHLLIESIFRAGFDPASIRWILHTHLHFDHFGASEEFRRLYGTKLAISAVDAISLRDYPERGLLDFGHSAYFKNPVFDRELEDGEIFEFGGVKIRCLLTPGHTLGVMSFFFDVTEDGKTYRAGLFGGTGHNAMRNFYMEKHELPKDMPQRMLRALDISAEEKVTVHLGNHPSNNRTLQKREQQLREGGNPFIDEGESWKSLLNGLREITSQIIRENEEELLMRVHDFGQKP